MSTTYQLTSLINVVRAADGALIPSDPANKDYQEYLVWLSVGNTPAPADAPTSGQIRVRYEAAAQELLDSTARAWGYDSVISAASYASSGVAQYKADAQALISWRDALWQKAFSVESDVKAGTIPMPATEADFLAMLPAAPTRPVA